LRKAIYPIIFAVFANSGAFRAGDKVERSMFLVALGIPVGLGALAILGAIVSHLVTRFGIVNGSLIVVKKGLWRMERTIPLERIQNVQVTQSLLERILKIATLKVETASGSGVEASLKSLSVADAEHIKQELLRTNVSSATAAPSTPPTIYKAEFKDIALAGALQNRALIVMAAILGVLGQGMDIPKVVFNALERSGIASAAERHPAMMGFVMFVGTLLFIVFGWLLSIGYAVFIYYGFKVVRTERGIQVSYGLVNTVQTVIPIKRVQSIQTRATWLFKLFGYCQLYAQSIAGHTAGQGQQVATGQTLIAPICRPHVLRTLIRLINPTLDVDKVVFLASDRYMLTRSLVRLCVSFGLLSIGVLGLSMRLPISMFLGSFGILVAGLFAFGIVGSILSYRRQGYAQTNDAFMVCSGTLGQNVTMIPIGNVQSVSLESSWFQRRRNLVDLHVMTPVSAAVVPCIPVETATRIKDSLMEQSCGQNRRGL